MNSKQKFILIAVGFQFTAYDLRHIYGGVEGKFTLFRLKDRHPISSGIILFKEFSQESINQNMLKALANYLGLTVDEILNFKPLE